MHSNKYFHDLILLKSNSQTLQLKIKKGLQEAESFPGIYPPWKSIKLGLKLISSADLRSSICRFFGNNNNKNNNNDYTVIVWKQTIVKELFFKEITHTC